MNLRFLTLAGAQYERSVSWLAISACLSWLAPDSQAKTAKMPNVRAKKIPTSCSTPSLRASSLFLSLRSVDSLWLELPIGEYGTFIGFVFVVFLAKWRFGRYRAGLQGDSSDSRQRTICARPEGLGYPGIGEKAGNKAVLASATESVGMILIWAGNLSDWSLTVPTRA